MANIQFNVAKGRINELAALAGASDSLIAVPLEATGIVSDATMRDYATLADILAGASNEQTTMGRQTLTGVAVAVDQATDTQSTDSADITWAAATGNPIAAIVICYKPDSGSADSAIIPLTKHDYAATPDGSDIVATVANIFTAS